MIVALQSWVDASLSGSLLLAIPVALLAGLVSFLSPCVLPLLPGYLSYASGLGASEIAAGKGARGPLVLGTGGFVLGFSLVFVATGALVSSVGALLIEHQRAITIIVGVLIVLLGFAFAGVLQMPELWHWTTTPRVGVAASPVLGIVFGLTFTPCIGPALSVVLSLAFNEGQVGRGALLAFCYALGLGLPFLAFAIAFSALVPKLEWLRRRQVMMQRIGGGLMVAVGLMMAVGWWDQLMALVRQWVANFGAIL